MSGTRRGGIYLGGTRSNFAGGRSRPIERLIQVAQASAEAREVCLVQDEAGFISGVPSQTSPAAAAAPIERLIQAAHTSVEADSF